MIEAEGPSSLWPSSLRYSLAFFIKTQSMKCVMLCPRLCHLGAYFDLRCLALNHWNLFLSLKIFLIDCILCLVDILMDFNKAFKPEEPDWLGQLFFLVSVDNQLCLFICHSFAWSYKALKTQLLLASHWIHYIKILCTSPGGAGQRRFWNVAA